MGLVHPRRVKRNGRAQAGDSLILGKPLGVGILSAALKKGLLTPEGYATMIRHTTKLNTPGTRLSEMDGVHALTDVTGFGLAGHLLEICRGSKLSATLRFDDLPLIPEAVGFVKEGISTGASTRNWSGYGQDVTLAVNKSEWQQKLLTDPQTSGGLLVACTAGAEQDVLAMLHGAGFHEACTIPGHRRAWPAFCRSLSCGCSIFQTFSRMIGCASATGWMLSGRKSFAPLRHTSSRKGTSAALCLRASTA